MARIKLKYVKVFRTVIGRASAYATISGAAV
jgi:hypothetical protein